MLRTYRECLSYLFSQLPMFQRQGSTAFKKDLTNIRLLLDRLDNPQDKFMNIHIAGTNGKGTVTHMIAGGLQSQGHRVGVYTSPHYRDFRERIKINGQFISKKRVVKYANDFQIVVEDIRPSFFEWTVAMAFYYFAEQEVDYAVIETGLGGRLDSTNVIAPLLSIITNISLDHTQFLGNTLEAIAVEKAGIIKKDTPVLIGEFQKETAFVFERIADQNGAELHYATDLVDVDDDLAIIKAEDGTSMSLDIDLTGPFLSQNLKTAIAGLFILNKKGLAMNWNKLERFFPNLATKTHLIGRFQWLQKDPDIIVDSAHNEAGVAIMVEYLNDLNYHQIHFVLGFSRDKDLGSILSLFPEKAHYYWCKADIPRGMPSDELKEQAIHFKRFGNSYTSVKRALAAAKKRQKHNELVYVGGSIFVVGEVL